MLKNGEKMAMNKILYTTIIVFKKRDRKGLKNYNIVNKILTKILTNRLKTNLDQTKPLQGEKTDWI